MLEIKSDTDSHDPYDGELLKKLFEVRRPDSLTEDLKNARVELRLNSSSLELLL